MNQKQIGASNFKKAPEIFLESTQFLKNEIIRLREVARNKTHRIEQLQDACDFYQDKDSTLEKILVDKNLMKRSSL